MKYENMTITELLEKIGKIAEMETEIEDLKTAVSNMSSTLEYLESEVN